MDGKLQTLLAEIAARRGDKRPFLVAIDGGSAGGKSTLGALNDPPKMVYRSTLEGIEHGKSNNGKSNDVDAVLGRSWVRKTGGAGNGNGTAGRGRNSGNAGVLRKQSERHTSPAFKSVLRNLLQDSENEVSGKQHSLKERGEYAPVFYSQMAKVIEGSKQEKLGAASVVPMLKGKGVKAEEIKRSGIETWLEGKKSVTKQEVLEFS